MSELFNYFSGLIGLVLYFIVLTFWKGHKKVQITLSLLLLTASVIVLLGALNFSGKVRNFPGLIRVDTPIHFLLGPAIYFFTLSYFKKDFRFRAIHLLNLLPFMVTLIYFLPFYFSSNSVKLDYYNGLMDKGTIVIQKLYLLKVIIVWLYFFGELYITYKYVIKDRSHRRLNKTHISWFVTFFALQFLSWSLALFDHITNLKTFPDPYQFSMNIVSLFLISIAFTLMFYPKLLYGINFKTGTGLEKYSSSSLSEVEKERILTEWMAFINGESKPFLDPKLAINNVAHLLYTNPQRLSQVINEKTGMNFNDYINSMRIEESMKILAGDDLNKLTIEGIALKSGFNSKSPFYAAFKKHTGLTPRLYLNSR